ncbi:uncharacterized protein V6R79_001122 [Siganus canaliculatus]
MPHTLLSSLAHEEGTRGPVFRSLLQWRTLVVISIFGLLMVVLATGIHVQPRYHEENGPFVQIGPDGQTLAVVNITTFLSLIFQTNEEEALSFRDLIAGLHAQFGYEEELGLVVSIRREGQTLVVISVTQLLIRVTQLLRLPFGTNEEAH